MISKDLTKKINELTTAQKIGFAAGASFIAGALFYLLRDSEAVPTDPPPILIKPGSFAIETDMDLVQTGSNPFVYRRSFGAILGIRLFRINKETGVADEDDFSDSAGIEVRIWLQYFSGYRPDGSIIWSPMTENRKITLKNNGNFFEAELNLEKKLGGKKLKKHPKRKAEYKDDESETFRFGRVQVYEKAGSKTTPYDAMDGDEFIITFYNYLI